MAAYAALVSLSNTIALEQRPRYHPHRRIFIEDGGLIQALKDTVDFLVNFIEGGREGAEHLGERIADAAYGAEVAIESYVVDQVLLDTSPDRSAQLRQDLSKLKQEMDSIMDEILQKVLAGSSKYDGSSSAPSQSEMGETKDKHDVGSSTSAGSSSAPRYVEKTTMVGFEEEKLRALEKLTRGHRVRTVLISIVGMGGAGKTTLARNIFDDQEIVEHYGVRIWVTVGQEYNVRKIFLQCLSTLNGKVKDEMSDEKLALELYQSLFNRTYLVVLDDFWSIDVWYEIRTFLPNCNCGSGIMVTTRLLTIARELRIATELSNYSCIMIKGLDEAQSWKLLCETVFGQDRTCPTKLESVGKKISQNCQGNPLAIIVAGSLLAKSSMERKYWEHVAKLSNVAIYLEEGDYSKTLSSSYYHLPPHLKPCFLYMAIFPENHVISISKLIYLWIAEGFLKPVSGKNLEEIGKEYLGDLISRNLILVHHRDSSGAIEYCSINGLLREFCLSEAEREKFFCVVTSHRLHDPPSLNGQRRIAILLNRSTVKEHPQIIDSLLTLSNPRSLIVINYYEELSRVLGSGTFKLLRVFFVLDYDAHTTDAAADEFHSKALLGLVNLRYLACLANRNFMRILASSIGLMGNLQMLFVRNFLYSTKGPLDIWNMPQLQHVEFDIVSLLEPPVDEREQHDYTVLPNLQTLQKLLNFRFEEGIIKKISNVKELKVWYSAKFEENKLSDYSFHNLERLEKLESFECFFFHSPDQLHLLQVFPRSLKKLSLAGCRIPWVDMTMIGSLPLLEVLELKYDSFIGSEWHPVKGKFLRLKFLCVQDCSGLRYWNADEGHFPCLQHLVLGNLLDLEKIPWGIGDISKLRLIELHQCSDLLVESAINIMEEQRKLGNDILKLKVTLNRHNKISLADIRNSNILVDARHQDPYMEDLDGYWFDD